MPIIQPQFYLDFGQWLDANTDELSKMAGVSQTPEIRTALREIAKLTGTDWNTMTQILVTISGNKLLQLFTRNTAYFSEIAKIAQRHTNAAFYALNATALSELMRKNPEVLKKLFSEVIFSASKSALPAAVDSALFALSNENLASLAAEKPEVLLNAFSQVTDITGKFAPHIFSAIADKNISALFVQDPRMILSAYSEVAAVSDLEAAAIFILALRRQRFFEIFKKSPEKLVKAFTDPAKVCGKNSAAVFYLLRNQRIDYMLEMNPESLIISLNAFIERAGKGAEDAITLIFDERVQDRFFDDAATLGESFSSLVTAALSGASNAVPLLRSGAMLSRFLEDPEPVVKFFSELANASGKYAQASFAFLAKPTTAAMLEKDPEGMMRRVSVLCDSCGDSTPIVFEFLGKETVVARFEEFPDRMVDFFSTIGKTVRGNKEALEFFANGKFIHGFSKWPEETMDNLGHIADSAGPYAGDVLKLLSRDRFAEAITEFVGGKHLAVCLTNLVTGSGGDAPMVLRLFKNDEFAKQFISDPYKEEQIVSRLRSFAGHDLSKALQILSDLDIALVFAEDPSVLVTTRFRYYVEGATAIPGITTFLAMDAVLKDRKVKQLFINYVRQEFHEGGDPQMLQNKLLPALEEYIGRSRS